MDFSKKSWFYGTTAPRRAGRLRLAPGPGWLWLALAGLLFLRLSAGFALILRSRPALAWLRLDLAGRLSFTTILVGFGLDLG